ncbi:hypothetical protein TNCV_1012821 [Trichonephila clavipes]|uniref:Uncharacterized protein n=1 Tax=Trichonephila clavipes TaxID=2585209 RepID=A0A8X6VX87_TRICX|nr:hypothetical protein TNCV_1012821 [Trichonephila clavipes]
MPSPVQSNCDAHDTIANGQYGAVWSMGHTQQVTIGIAFQASITAEVSACSEDRRFCWLRNLRSNSSQRCSMGFRSGL